MSRQHVEFVRQRGGVICWKRDVEGRLGAQLAREYDRLAALGCHVYVTVDADVVRAADMPGVSAPNPYPVNELFGLVATVEEGCDPPRRPVDVRLRVDAAMPDHRHGMNTEAVVTSTGAGRFVVDGLLLHMPGRWELYFDVTDGAVTERAQLDFARMVTGTGQ